MDVRNIRFHDGFGIFMMVLNFPVLCFDFFYTEAIVGSVHFSAILQVRQVIIF
jgi:hypothetical protein